MQSVTLIELNASRLALPNGRASDTNSDSLPFAKDRGAHAHHRRAFLNRDLEIVGHAHRQLTATIAENALAFQLISQFTQAPEVRPHAFGLLKKRWQRH